MLKRAPSNFDIIVVSVAVVVLPIVLVGLMGIGLYVVIFGLG
jgi:hypothetical protein